VTYEGFAAAWPDRSGELADRMNTMPKHVASTTLRALDRNNSALLDGEITDRTVLELADTQAFDSGVVVHTYRPSAS
jgi:hypothetical protein